VIVHLKNFIEQERPALEELEATLRRLEEDPALALTVAEVERLDYLYHRAASALSKLASLPATEAVREHLSAVVARAHMELYDVRAVSHRFRPARWFFGSFPAALRRHLGALGLAIAVTLVGSAFGAYALSTDQPDVKELLMPFSHLQGGPKERVKREEHGASKTLAAHHGQFAAQLMVNNIRVSITAMAFGVFFGLGTLVLLFYNGVILGAVVFDYLHAGQGLFLAGWLLPHGSIEIPAILVAGQAGFVLGGALLGWGDPTPFSERLRRVAPDLVTLIGGVAVMLVWAGLVESFLSQYHEPVVPYAAKIALGIAESLGLILLLSLGGRLRAVKTKTGSSAANSRTTSPSLSPRSQLALRHRRLESRS
jgi:uncharacterized membrane protein SpoIIM required for sporulation